MSLVQDGIMGPGTVTLEPKRREYCPWQLADGKEYKSAGDLSGM